MHAETGKRRVRGRGRGVCGGSRPTPCTTARAGSVERGASHGPGGPDDRERVEERALKTRWYVEEAVGRRCPASRPRVDPVVVPIEAVDEEAQRRWERPSSSCRLCSAPGEVSVVVSRSTSRSMSASRYRRVKYALSAVMPTSRRPPSATQEIDGSSYLDRSAADLLRPAVAFRSWSGPDREQEHAEHVHGEYSLVASACFEGAGDVLEPRRAAEALQRSVVTSCSVVVVSVGTVMHLDTPTEHRVDRKRDPGFHASALLGGASRAFDALRGVVVAAWPARRGSLLSWWRPSTIPRRTSRATAGRARGGRRDCRTACRGAALFADISGFTPLTEALARELGPQRGAEELTAHLNRVFHAVIAELDRYGGDVIYFSGDAITCWLDGDDGTRAVALRPRACRRRWRERRDRHPGGRSVQLGMKVADRRRAARAGSSSATRTSS